MYDLNGKLIYSGQVENNTAIEVGALEKGIYLVYLPGTGSVKKFVKN